MPKDGNDALISRLQQVQGLSATVSDLLDRRGFRLALSSSSLVPRVPLTKTIVGRAVTMRYLPHRQEARTAVEAGAALGYPQAYAASRPSDVLVVETPGASAASAMGAIAASAALDAGIAACIIDGGVRDVAQIAALGLPVWSRVTTPITGKGRLDLAEINGRIQCAGVQVCPGDLVIADETGICFVPDEIVDEIVAAALEVVKVESARIRR